jgi:hypothetical protein
MQPSILGAFRSSDELYRDQSPFIGDFEEETEGHRAGDVEEWPVFFLPNHAVARNLQALERRLLAEERNHGRVLYFRPLTESDLKSWSPFRTRTDENAFLVRGYAYDLRRDAPNAAAPVMVAGNTAHQRAEQESLTALRALTFLTSFVIKIVQQQTEVPAWLQEDVFDILTPVCGKGIRPIDLTRALRKGVYEPNRELALIRADGLLWACDDFGSPRQMLPSLAQTPGTALRTGRDAVVAFYHADIRALEAAIVHELGGVERGGLAFDPFGAALWLCQATMLMRMSAEDVRRRAYAWHRSMEISERIIAEQNAKMTTRIAYQYDFDKGDGRHANLVVSGETASMMRRSLTAFFGVARDPWNYYAREHLEGDPNFDAYAFDAEIDLQAFCHWAGELRRNGQAILGLNLAHVIRNYCEVPDERYRFLTEAPAGKELASLLTNLFSADAWDALHRAALLVLSGKRRTVKVTYSWTQFAQRGPFGRFHHNHVEIVGPLLMLPMHGADVWRGKAAQIPERGLYLAAA